jgi:hypothetical protein
LFVAEADGRAMKERTNEIIHQRLLRQCVSERLQYISLVHLPKVAIDC